MGKCTSFRLPKSSHKQESASASGGNRILTNQALGDAIAKKQQIDTVKKVNDILKVKPHLALRVLHVLESGMFECTTNTDFIPPSTNKFRLLSLNHCKELLLAIVPNEKKEKFAQELALVRVKSVASQLLCYLARCNEGCALPSRSIPRLHQVVRDRASEVPGRWERFEIVSNSKVGKAEANIVLFPKGIFQFTDYCGVGKKYKKVMHIDSGIKVDIWDEIVTKKDTAIMNNWNEFAAFVKIRAEVYIMQMFEEESDGDKPSSEKKYHGVPWPLDSDVIPERRTSTEEAEAATEVAPTAAQPQATAELQPSQRKLKKVNSAASDTSAVPDGWGGSMKQHE